MTHIVVKYMPYMGEPWFAMLLQACQRENNARVAARLNVSGSTVGQVLRGTGEYGTGKASTQRLAQRVLHRFGSYECPHLTEQYGEPRVITSDECRAVAHRATPPIGSPGLMSHWRACNSCPHKALSAPPAPKPATARNGVRPATADELASAGTTSTSTGSNP